ncbi:MAG: PAS domain S-box protein, partial [Thermodesulfobacteriota bacterium]
MIGRIAAGLSIRAKLTAVIVLTSAAALVLAAGAFVAHEVFTYRSSLVAELTSLARVVGSNTTAALSFDDRRAAAETLAGLSGEPHILRAALYDEEGRRFAVYPPSAEADAAPDWARRDQARSPTHRFFPSYLELAHPVVFDGDVVGTVVLRSSLEALRARLLRLVAIALGILALASLVAYSLSLALGRLIARPVQDLAETMGRVSREGDFSLRAAGGGQDELGALVDGFNRMLAQLQARDEELLRLATAVEQAAEAIVVTDTHWRIQYVNPAFEHITGYARQEALGEHIRLLRSGENAAELLRDLEERVAGGEPWSGRLVNRRKDGSLYEEECTVSPVRDDRGRIVNYVAVKRDVTAEVRLEKQLRQSQKLEALGTLAGGIAHDFNNVLTPILGYTEMAVDDLPPDSRVRDGLTRVLAAAERARDLVKQILAFSRRAEQERRPVHLGDLVRETLRLVSATLPKTIEIRSRLDDDPGPVVADATQLHQVLLNLCTNAWHAM